MAVLLPHALFRFSSLLLRIENPYTQWVWIANPDQRHGMEHPLDRNHFIKNVAVMVNIMIMGKAIKVPLRVNTMNLHSLTSSFSSIIPFSFNSCNLRTIIIVHP